jgi:NADH-quinone oxidoreductase E subunit
MTDLLKHIIYKYPDKKQKDLIPILQEIQNENGYITESHIQELSDTLNIASSKIYSIATFYDQFQFSPNAKCHIRVCSGSACHVMGIDNLKSEIITKLEIQQNMKSRNGQFSLEEVPCLGACALAPLIEINGEFYGKLTTKKLDNIIENLLESINKAG